MDFKFSCKWFEVSFSGDPGYVERQIEKYESYILQALKQMEIEQQQEEEAQKSKLEAKSKTAATEENGPREKPHYNKRRKNHSGRGRAPDKKERTSTHTYRKEYNSDQSSRSDYMRNQIESENGGQENNEEDDSIPFPEGGQEKPHHQHNSSETNADKPGPESKPVGPEADTSSSDFPSRRKTPRIKAEDLVKTIDGKKPRTHHDRVMVFGHYMETQGGGSDFTIPEIKRCYRAANQDPGNNIEQVINHATRSGFIVRHEQARTNRFKLSNKGRRYVEDGLKLT